MIIWSKSSDESGNQDTTKTQMFADGGGEQPMQAVVQSLFVFTRCCYTLQVTNTWPLYLWTHDLFTGH